MTIAIILNGISRKKYFYRKLLPALSKRWAVEVQETRAAGHAVTLAREATASGRYDLILAAGGDGTLHHVLNGLLAGGKENSRLPVLGVIPLGSGNDFARSVKITGHPARLVELIASFNPRPVDIGKIQYTPPGASGTDRTGVCYFINEADIGMGPEVVKKVQAGSGCFGPGIAYYNAILATFFRYRPFGIQATAPGWTWTGKIRTLAVANGRYYGHGLGIAPGAKPDDAMFSVFIAGDVTVLAFIRFTGTLKRAQKVVHKKVHYFETPAVELTSELPCVIEADGELVGMLPAKIGLAKDQLRFLM